MRGRWAVVSLVVLLTGCASAPGGGTDPAAMADPGRLRHQVEQDVSVWQERGIEISSVELSPDRRRVVVSSPQADRLRTLAHDRYGRQAPLDVVKAGPIRPVSPS